MPETESAIVVGGHFDFAERGAVYSSTWDAWVHLDDCYAAYRLTAFYLAYLDVHTE